MARRSRFTEAQIVVILQQHDAGLTIKDISRKHGISEQTFYRWRSKYGGLAPSEIRRLKQLEDWRRDYNETRPHSSLGDRAPATFVAEFRGLSPAAQINN